MLVGACVEQLGHLHAAEVPVTSRLSSDQALKYAKCMRANGYNMPDPVFGGGAQPAQAGPTGAAKDTYDKANAICSAK